MTITPTPTDTIPLVDYLRAATLPSRARRREIRKAVGASVRDVAAAVGVSHFAVHCWEKPDGTIEPSRTHRLRYKQVLDALEALAGELDQTQK